MVARFRAALSKGNNNNAINCRPPTRKLRYHCGKLLRKIKMTKVKEMLLKRFDLCLLFFAF